MKCEVRYIKSLVKHIKCCISFVFRKKVNKCAFCLKRELRLLKINEATIHLNNKITRVRLEFQKE